MHDHAVESSEQWKLKGDKNYYSAHNFTTRLNLARVIAWWQSWQCSQNICGPFPRAVPPMIVKAGRSSNGGWQENKELVTPPSRWVSAPRYSQNLCRTLLGSQTLSTLLYLHGTVFPLPGVQYCIAASVMFLRSPGGSSANISTAAFSHRYYCWHSNSPPYQLCSRNHVESTFKVQ